MRLELRTGVLLAWLLASGQNEIRDSVGVAMEVVLLESVSAEDKAARLRVLVPAHDSVLVLNLGVDRRLDLRLDWGLELRQDWRLDQLRVGAWNGERLGLGSHVDCRLVGRGLGAGGRLGTFDARHCCFVWKIGGSLSTRVSELYGDYVRYGRRTRRWRWRRCSICPGTQAAVCCGVARNMKKAWMHPC